MSATTPVYLNGRFLSQGTTGVQRFARMIVCALDAMPGAGETFTLLVPPGVSAPDWLRAIPWRQVGRRRGHLWEQTELAWASRKGILVSLCNAGPVTHSRSLTVIHDASVYRYPEQFARGYRLFHQTLGRLLARRTRIATVSRFSRAELAEALGLSADAVAVIPNAADHVDAIVPDADTLARLGLERGRYLLLVGSFAPNKNMPAAIAAFETIAGRDERLVIVGASVSSFTNDDLSAASSRIVRAGRVDDASLVALYRGARALVFPSIYEGFGIPPLEAMRIGVPVIASAIASVKEVCGDAAAYFDPYDRAAMGAAMRRILDDEGFHTMLVNRALERGRLGSWAESARMLRFVIGEL